LACPLVVMARPTLFGSDRAVLIVASGGLIAALLVRAVSAVRGYARVQEGLLQQATHDGLTGLPNRVLLTQRIQALLGARRSPEGAPCLLFLDLDGFKLVNDHWGHETGDLLLIEVARRLVGLAGLDRTVARISGDEFVVAGSDGPEQAAALAAQIQQALSQPVELPSLELVVTGSIGIAGRTDQTGAEELLRDADMAMYRAKAEGRNRWMVFDASMRQTLRDRVEIELALRHAIRRGQLWVAYQPITDTFTQRTVGAEALVRWTHPVRGPIPPAEFIPVAEETGLITEIGTWVLQESLHQLAAWRDQGILPAGFSLSVNASTRQILDHALHDAIAQGLRHHHLDPAQLTVEITESVMMGNPETVSEVLGDLRALGIHLSVDDFGTGYSSLSYLSWFPVTGVKVDRAFVDGLGVDERDEAIVRAVVAMACALGLSVIAEGVETQRQREILCRLGVEQGQGWLWGTAVDGADFADRHLDVTGVQAGVGNSYAQ